MSQYSTKDIFLERRTANQTFEEAPLHVQPNSIIVSDAFGNLAMVDTASFIAGTGSVHSAVSSSIAESASYATTASYLNDFVVAAISGSNFTHTGDQIAVTATPLSFTMQAGETWTCNAYLSTQSSNNRGMVYAISSSAGTIGDVEGWVMTELNAITTPSRQRLTAVNTKMATLVHTQINTPGPDQIQLCIVNPSTTTTISIAVAVSNNNDTVTVFQGSYLIAKRVRVT